MAPLDKSGIRLIFFAMLLAGIGPTLVRNSPVDFAATAFWRLAIALPVAYFMARRSILLPWRSMLWIALGGLLLGGDLVFWNGAVMHTTILEATILVMLYPLLVAIGGYLIFKERVTARLGLGGAIAFGGLILMVTTAAKTNTGNSSLLGDGMAIAAAFFYGGSVLISSHHCRKHDTVAVTFWVMCWGAVGALPFVLLGERPYPVTWDGWLYIAFYGAVTLASYSLFNRGLRTVPAAMATILGYGQPVIATLIAYLFMHETPALLGIVGSCVIIGGLAIATIQPKAVITVSAPAE